MTPEKPSAPLDFHPDTPLLYAAREVLASHLESVERLVRQAARDAAPRVVHQLRVGTRRAAAALRLFRGVCPGRTWEKLRKRLRKLRRAAGAARRFDVFNAQLAEYFSVGPEPVAVAAGLPTRITANAPPVAADPVVPSNGRHATHGAVVRMPGAPPAALVAQMRRAAFDARVVLRRACRRRVRVRLKRIRTRLLAGLRGRLAPGEALLAAAPYTLADEAVRVLPPLLDAFRAAPLGAAAEPAAFHEFRLACKRLRYTVELLAGCLRGDTYSRVTAHLAGLQDKLGSINDIHELLCAWRPGAARSDGLPEAATAADSATQRRELRRRLHTACTELLDDCAGRDSVEVLALLEERVRELDERDPQRVSDAHVELHSGADPLRVRVAAIDIGTNSMRLVIAESDPAGGFRVLEDLRETTRLGAGLYRTGRLDPAAVEGSLRFLEHMRETIRARGVTRIRAVGTSALREATNGAAFLEAARARTGIEVAVIDADREARLAFASVAGTFDLANQRVAVVDLGGGSTEVVLSTDGLIDTIYRLPLGAVRLTEMYGMTGGEYRASEMGRAVDLLIGRTLGTITRPPQALIGTGGTFTALAKIFIRRGALPHREGRFPFALRGCELTIAEVSELTAWLREMSLEQRRRVPGLGSRRAEIIVAGGCIVERLMQHMRVPLLRVHDGGIRDGLLLEMFDEAGIACTPLPQQRAPGLAAVRAFARRMKSPRAHSEHVAHLALRIFDQLAVAAPGATWTAIGARELLQQGALLHDVGLLLGIRKHNRHGADMIARADLAALRAHPRLLLAGLARYHRGRGPRTEDALLEHLSEVDQRLLAHLAGILRIADGLDRRHLQCVTDVQVRVTRGRVRFVVSARRDPSVELRHAWRKSAVFAEHFGTPVEFARARASAADPVEQASR